MIISRITSGLGNQMFQYAIGKSLSFQHKSPLKMDVTNFEIWKNRSFGLNNFNIHIEAASKDEIESFIKRKKYADFFKPYKNRKYIQERYFKFDPVIKNLKSNNIYLSGYWQSEKYFKESESEIRRDFTFKYLPNAEVKDVLDLIMNQNSVSIHIRRGDYTSNPLIAKTHGALPLEYYIRAIEYLNEKFHDLKWYIFSDDIDWVRNNLKIHQPAFFVENKSDIEDLFLMSNCKHNIIANSSFSWWAAWLNSNIEKIVIMPQRWFLNKKYDQNDIAPADWIRL